MKIVAILELLLVLALDKTYARNLHTQENETVASRYLKDLNEQLTFYFNKANEAMFDNFANPTEEIERKVNEESFKLSSFMAKVANDLRRFDWRSYNNSDIRRQFKLLPTLGYNLRNETQYIKYRNVKKALNLNFKQAKTCKHKNADKCDKLYGDIGSMTNNPEQLIHYWRKIHEKNGKNVRQLFEEYVRLGNEVANLDNFTSKVELELDEYDDNTLGQQLDAVFTAVRPLFEQIHAFLRHRMQGLYGKDNVSSNGTVPIHLFRHMLSQDPYNSTYSFLPYPRKAAINITTELVRQGYTPSKMFQLADGFFTSMNMTKLPGSFWNNSILEKPDDGRDITCGSLMWDLYKKDGVRIIQCTLVNQDNFFEIHRHLSNLQYNLQYQNQPFLYRSHAYFAMLEAFPEAVLLSVSAPKHLERIGLLPNYVPDEEERMNRLFLTALKTIFHAPFLISQEKFIWALSRNEFENNKWNCVFWKVCGQYSGIEPPVKRNNSDFDIPALYGISSYRSLLSKIGALIVPFQLYKSACIKASQYDPNNPDLPLDNCDFYGSAEAGKSFSAMLSLGNSKPWPDVLEAFNGERKMNASAMLEYFKPLESWLRAENAKNNVSVGWTESDKCSE